MDNFKKVKNYIQEIIPLIEKPATSKIKYPYLAISYGQHYPNMLCWDFHHMAMRFAYSGKPSYMKFLIANLLEYQMEDGYVPNGISESQGPYNEKPRFHAQPFLMQSALMYIKQTGDSEGIKKDFLKLVSYLSYYEQNYKSPCGLFFWQVGWMSGFDNDIVTNIFQHQTIISADLSSWMVLEYRSAYHIAKILGLEKLQALYKEKALKLSQLINDKLWNEEMDSYSAYNLVSQKQMLSYKDPYLDSSIGLYAFQSCSNIIPLYARIADNDKASRMIEKYIINENHFASPFGIRSLSKASEYYNNAKWGNPPRFGDPNRLTNSNWQGPVWIPLNYFMYHALSYYGFEGAAKVLADKTMKVLAKSIDSIGSFAENYNADTAEPLYATKFASWNILADTMSKDFSGQRWCMFPIFENMD